MFIIYGLFQGYYTGTSVDCIAVVCGEPVETEHATLTKTGITYKHTSTYICDEGYFMLGKKKVEVCFIILL